MCSAADVLVVGAGPAGTAAAISAAAAGLTVTIVDRVGQPHRRPGETLHPGIATIFAKLGVEAKMAAVSPIRHSAQAVRTPRGRVVTAFGHDEHGPWRGYQIQREDLDAILLDRASDLGARFCRRQAGPPVVLNGRVIGVEDINAGVVIDASGRRGWLRRALALPTITASPPLTTWYGYCRGTVAGAPELSVDHAGWTWTAQVAPRKVHWARMAFPGSAEKRCPPTALRTLPCLRRGRADVTWRWLPACAGPGWFAVGDAAIVHDPSAGHGVLRAVMTGIASGRAACAILDGATDASAPAAAYRADIAAWFNHDSRRLRTEFAQLQNGDD
jgi:flavin-dependent dehydrogenase